MRNGPGLIGQFCTLRPFAAAALAGSALVTGAGAGLAQPGAEKLASVTIQVTDLRSQTGNLRACMTANPNKFPDCEGVPHSAIVAAENGALVTFLGVKPGRYAIALLHDENKNGKADRALMMIPREGFGFSRDAKVRMGPPKFDAAAFDVAREPVRQTIRIRYLL